MGQRSPVLQTKVLNQRAFYFKEISLAVILLAVILSAAKDLCVARRTAC
jgi:hypothetical protein